MKKRWGLLGQRGFTIVELLIVIVVIGILAAIVIVAYTGIQKSASVSTVKSDVSNVAKKLMLTQTQTGAYPDVLPADAKVSPDTTLSYVRHTTGGYSGLGGAQNGVLFRSICQQIIGEGFGRGTNINGGSEQYVTSCNVYNSGAMQINGWDAHDFTTPISSGTIAAWYNANVNSDSFRPNKKSVYLAFANELSSRFAALGGVFPVSIFWDRWVDGENGPSLPAPNAPSDPTTFCVEASHVRYTDIHYYATQGSGVKSGECP